MKKLTIFISCILIILCISGYIYVQYSREKSDIDKHNVEYENIYNKEINGNNLASLINKTIDSNERNFVEKDKDGLYIENDSNSIKIDIKFKDSETIFPIEKIYLNQISTFIRLYGQATFKCTKKEYHNNTKYIKYLYFEEI